MLIGRWWGQWAWLYRLCSQAVSSKTKQKQKQNNRKHKQINTVNLFVFCSCFISVVFYWGGWAWGLYIHTSWVLQVRSLSFLCWLVTWGQQLKPHHPLQCASHSHTMFFVQLWCCFAIVTPDKPHYLRIMVLPAIVEVNPMLLFPIPYCCPQVNSPHAVHHMLCHTQVEPVCKYSKTSNQTPMTPLCVWVAHTSCVNGNM